jgi:phage/conjugal plasmid C-4 type zinc finger TraR family protein
MADEIDQAQEMDERFRESALREQLHSREPSVSTSADCVDCGEEIPVERRAAVPGCLRCVGCQEEHEMHSNWRPL